MQLGHAAHLAGIDGVCLQLLTNIHGPVEVVAVLQAMASAILEPRTGRLLWHGEDAEVHQVRKPHAMDK
jgi:hypothetical protein